MPKGRTDKNAVASEGGVALLARQQRAMELRVAGHSYRDIAAQTGVSVGQAYADVTAGLRELKAINESTAEELRAVEAERLDIATKAVLDNVAKGSPVAIASLLRIQERRAKLLGIDTPTKGEDAAAATAQMLAALLGVSPEDIATPGVDNAAADS